MLLKAPTGKSHSKYPFYLRGSEAGGLGDAAGLGSLGFRLGKSADVKVYWPDVLPGPAVAFALGLYDVNVWGRSLVSYGSGDVLILCWGEEQYLSLD